MSLPRQSYPIVSGREEDYNCFALQDGNDYAALWRGFKKGEIKPLEVLKDVRTRKVYVVEAWGRKYVLKKDTYVSRHLEVKLWRALQGPFHSRQMRLINRAVANGCTVTPEIYFVAEKRGGLVCRESWIIMEMAEGRSINRLTKDYRPYHERMAAAMHELHRHGLALSDVGANNFVLTEQGEIKLIDLSWQGVSWTGVGQDVAYMLDEYGIEIKVEGLLNRLAVHYVAFKHKLRRWFHSK